MFKKVDPKMNLPKMEEEILAFWNENKIFEKSLSKRASDPLYAFYDGPPFATGTPHYGHIVASTMKDVVPRYFTMKGYRVPRKWGWDCHGLPIENIVEKELGYKTKKDIEKLGVEKFNALCRSKVLTYVSEWKKVINRLGRWADMENAYKTMDLEFMESVWWVFKELYDKGLIYEGYRSMHICPRCETTLSQSEVAEGYKTIKDLSATVKFGLEGKPGIYILAWTTTPWTLIGNVALAVGEKMRYVEVRYDKEKYIIAKDLIDKIIPEDDYELISEFDGKDLIGKRYKPLFDYYSRAVPANTAGRHEPPLQNLENGWKIYPADFVTTVEGTGVVHIAPAFGEDDMNLGKKYNLPFIQHVGMDGVIKKEAGEFSGMNVKPIGDTQKTDVEIIKYLAHKNLLFSKKKYEHSYPHCWRCETPLINYATSSWFVSITKFKERMIELARDINWSPKHIKIGRFGNWLESARDWSISRQRFWASVMPIWKCECGEIKVFGSVAELEKISGERIIDIHKDVVDKITFPCEKCKGEMKRVPDVLDTWFDSGSMPYAQSHYPFENKESFEKGYPAEFIAEGIDQTRAWFYYLHAIATAIKDSRAFTNVVVNGIVLAEDGKKMAKRLNNYPDPTYVMDKYGADPLRYYLLNSSVMQAENLNFKEADVAELVRGIFRMLWNSYSFFVLYANIDKFKPNPKTRFWDKSLNLVLGRENILDKWIISELQTLINEVNQNMEHYELTRAARCFPKFIDNLSNWYIRRSRRRFWKSESDSDKKEAYETLHYVLVTLAKLMAPFTPFIAEEIYKNLTNEESVHLADFPVADEKLVDEKLNQEMAKVREIITQGLQLRAKAKIKVRQPLKEVRIKKKEISEEILEIVKEELNVKEIKINEKQDQEIVLDTEITEDLRLEGVAREIIRHIQEMRKEAGYEVDNRIEVYYTGSSEVFKKFRDIIMKETLADSLNDEEPEDYDLEKEFSIENNVLIICIKKQS
jgi:isoleucyl-tRNA synthetase